MDLNHIGLSPELIAELYKDHIVEFISDEPSPQKKSAEPINTPPREVAVIIRYPDSEISDKSSTLLKNLLKAAGLKLGDVEVIDVSKKSYGKTDARSKIVLLFGVTPEAIDLPINFPEYQVQAFNGITYLCSPSLEELEHDKVSKSKLWVCLKKIFNL